MRKLSALRQALLLAVSGAFLMSSCKKETDVTPSPTTAGISSTVTSGPVTTQEVNDWILANMNYYYLWNDKLPTNPDKSLTPDNFFKSLLYDYTNTANPDRDRFSWIQESAQELQASLSGQSKTTGMEYKLFYRDQTRANVIGSVLYVLPGSPAAQAGLKRGDIFTKVNGQPMTATNYQDLLSGDVITFGMASLANGAVVDNAQTKQVMAVVFQEDPVLLDTTYTIGGKTIGYVVYNQFIPGANGSTANEYDGKLDNIFGQFKQKGVTELVLDLRYNRGGYVSSSTKLASLIGKNVDASKVYYAQKWNNTVTADYNQRYGPNWNTQHFVSKPNNIGANLNRVYVLTTGSTASASELIINGLRPYMTVTTIGLKTIGKNVGSITISDKSGRIKWGMQPLTFKSANADGFTDYAGGFTPSVEVTEPIIGMKAFGDINETLLSEAIGQITGSRTARRAAPTVIDALPGVGSSLDRKAAGGNMFADAPGVSH
ncbi:S41 family peptidase [Spirosoma fluminis]